MKVSVRLGATIPSIDYGNVRPEVELLEVDCDGDIEAQIEHGIAVAGQVFNAIDGKLLDWVDTATAQTLESMKAGERIAKLERDFKHVADVLRAAKKEGKL